MFLHWLMEGTKIKAQVYKVGWYHLHSMKSQISRRCIYRGFSRLRATQSEKLLTMS